MVHDTLYKQVRNQILRIIIERNYGPNELLPSESEISELCNVSKMTSKLALNLLVEEGVITRIPRRGSFLNNIDMNFVRNKLLSDSSEDNRLVKNSFIALIVPSIDPYIGDIIIGIEKEAKVNNLNIIIKFSNNKRDEEEKIIAEISKIPEIKGIILFPGDRNNCGPELLNLKITKYPIVIIDRVFKEILFDSVFHDFTQGTKDIVNYLVEKGHNNIGYISRYIDNVTSTEAKYQGYINGMMENSKLISSEYIHFLDETLNSQEIEEYLKGNKELTAIVCSDDYIAAIVYRMAVKLGRNIPKDLSITGFSDNSLLKFLPVGMTTIRQPVEELCVKAVEILQKKISQPGSIAQIVKIKTQIIQRESA